MGTYSRHQAYPDRSVRIPAYVITLGLMVVSAIVVVLFVILPALAWLFSMGTYIETVAP